MALDQDASQRIYVRLELAKATVPLMARPGGGAQNLLDQLFTWVMLPAAKEPE